MQALVWPGELAVLEINILAIGEQVPQQLALFAEDVPPTALPLQTLVAKLLGRYPGVFFRGQVEEASHPVVERRSQLLSLQ